MKALFLLPVAILLFATSAQAQNSYRATGTYFYPNGFRTVSEENALMEQTLAERRKRDRAENGEPDQDAQARIKQEEGSAEKKRGTEAKPKPAAKTKAK